MSTVRTHKMADFQGGWLVGSFVPNLRASREVEVGLKYFAAGDTEPTHFQKTVTEFTVVAQGRVKFGDLEFEEGTIVEIPPMVALPFESLTDSVLLVIKTPSIPADKVVGRP